MKYWSFWYFWSIFFLIFATMCNINTHIPVYQNQRSHAEQDHSLLLGSSSTSSCTSGWASGSGCSSGMGSSVWTHSASWAVTHLCPHPLAGPWWFLQKQFPLSAQCLGSWGSLEEKHFHVLQPGTAIRTARDGRNGICSASEKAWPQHISSRF